MNKEDFNKPIGKCNFNFFSNGDFKSSGVICIDDIIAYTNENPGELVVGAGGRRYAQFRTVKLNNPKDHNTHMLVIGKSKFSKKDKPEFSGTTNRMIRDKIPTVIGEDGIPKVDLTDDEVQALPF